MEPKELVRLEKAVQSSPGAVGKRLCFGLALLEDGRKDEAAKELRLAAKLDPSSPYVAVAAALAMARCGHEREAMHLLSTQVHPTKGATLVAESELQELEGLMKHSDIYVRCHLAKAVGRLWIVDCRAALERACSDENFAVRSAAAASLKVITAH